MKLPLWEFFCYLWYNEGVNKQITKFLRMWVLVLQRMLFDFLWDIIYFPVWWFSGGLLLAGRFCRNLWISGNLYLSPALWLKNIFVPMFGQYDWQGRLVSFFMRLVNVVGRSLALLVWTILVCLFFLLWLFFPFFVIYMFINSW